MTSLVSILLPTSSQTLYYTVDSVWQVNMKHGPLNTPISSS